MQQNEHIGATTPATVVQQIPFNALVELVLSRNKQRTIAAKDPLFNVQQEQFEERAAIMEFDNNLGRIKAKVYTMKDT